MDPVTYQGSCHCGAVRYNVTAVLDNLIACNCSMCSRAGTLLKFVPEESFTLEAGEDFLTDYQFNKHVIHHVFCKKCGIKPFARGTGPGGKPMVAINTRCLENVDLQKLPVTHYDGKNH